MHMADALLSPSVGGIMWATSAGILAYSAKKVSNNLGTQKIPLMGVLGAFIFAAQMINFTIPGTGSSGHIGGGMILAILLGPYAGFLTIASVLVIQALLFADGGLLALGCNIFNMGFFPCFIAYPFIYKVLKGKQITSVRNIVIVIFATIIGLDLGAFSVVLETFMSGITELTFGKFLLLMLPIHLAIGFIEGVITITVVSFVWKARPELLEDNDNILGPSIPGKLRKVIIGFAVAALIIGGILSWLASVHPDGLEWSVFHVTGREEPIKLDRKIYSLLEKIQDKTAILPDYNFKKSDNDMETEESNWPDINGGTTVSGIAGGIFTLILILIVSLGIKGLKGKLYKP